MSSNTTYDLRAYVRDVPNFPKEGIVFRDIAPLLADPDVFNYAIDTMVMPWLEEEFTHVGMLDARGFVFGTALAVDLGLPFFMIRKSGKLPGLVAEDSYDLEYGKNTLSIAHNAFEKESRVLLVDDVLATGGSAAAAARLVSQLGGEVVGLAVLMELTYCEGRKTFKHPVKASIVY